MTKECVATRDHKGRRNSKLENATGELRWFRGPVSWSQRPDLCCFETVREGALWVFSFQALVLGLPQ